MTESALRTGSFESRVAHLPGVVAEGVVSALRLTGEVGWGGINVEGYTPPPEQELQVDIRVAGTDYFRTMEIPLRKCRCFTEDDNADKPQAVIIDEKFAQRFWPDSDPIGKHLWFDSKKPMTVVGVVGVVKQYGLETDGKVATYFPYLTCRREKSNSYANARGAKALRRRWCARCQGDHGLRHLSCENESCQRGIH